ncbi:MAG TPA: ATP-binding protein [Sphingobium sp.]|uniref:ATP-binding protein n=1 Tax=Sphingobium sp. TaxID=1912891 RepID=UPI002ED0B700
MTDTSRIALSPPLADAGRRNMELLLQLRWIAVGGQLVTIAAVYWLLHIDLPIVDLLLAVGMLVAINLCSMVLLLGRTRPITNGELTFALLLDVATLTWQLHHSGGLSNPFSSLFLLQVVIGATMLKPASSWGIVGATLVALAVLGADSRPLPLPPAYAADRLKLYIEGSLVCFLLIAVLLVLFVTRISRNLSERDAALASVRQRAAEEDHIVRMGLLASGAAHELGTPLSSLSVLIGDWKTMPRFAEDAEMREDLEDMEAAIKRCKAIVSGILMSAGEARGIAPEFTTVRGFIRGIVTDWSAIRLPGTVHLDDRFGEDVPIISDLALRQVITNIIDNAAEVSPRWVSIAASRERDSLVLDIADRGPGFSQAILDGFGQPYLSTKGKPGGGLGLFLLVNVVRKLGGEASASNREEGGALVRVILPLETLSYGKEIRA